MKDEMISIHKTAKEKGFWDKPDRRIALLMIHSEVSEAVEALRKGDFDQYCEELGDIYIRLLDLMGYETEVNYIDIREIIVNKRMANEKRPHKHGKEF